MAFTSSEKRQIRSYLGYSGGFRDYNVTLESMMDVVGSEVDESAYARTLLTGISDVDANLAGTGGGGSSATYGTIKKVDEIEFFPVTSGSGSSSTLSGIDYGEVLIERLRALFSVELAGRYFRSSSNKNFFFGPGV